MSALGGSGHEASVLDDHLRSETRSRLFRTVAGHLKGTDVIVHRPDHWACAAPAITAFSGKHLPGKRRQTNFYKDVLAGEVMGPTSDELKAAEPVYEALARVARTVPGWTPPEQMLALYSAVAFDRSVTGDVVEIGAWCGRSTIALGIAAKEVGCRVHTVDIFPEKNDWRQNADGSWSIRTQIDGRIVEGCVSQTVWDEAFQRDVLPVYAGGNSPRVWLDRCLQEFSLADTVTVHRGTARDFVRRIGNGLQARLVFVDGDHAEIAVREDLEALLPLLVPGGLMCLDDAFTCYDGVDRAIMSVLREGTQPIGEDPIRVTRKMLMVRKRQACGPQTHPSEGANG